jgi:hypothetical protein
MRKVQRTAWGGAPGNCAIQSEGSWKTGAAGRSDKNACDAVGATELVTGAHGTVIDSGLAADTSQQERSEGVALIWPAEEFIPIMWQGCAFSPEGAMRRQWSGVAAAGITNSAMLATTATTFAVPVIPTPLCSQSEVFDTPSVLAWRSTYIAVPRPAKQCVHVPCQSLSAVSTEPKALLYRRLRPAGAIDSSPWG